MNNDTNKMRPKILLPKVDVIFKLLFGDKRNEEILVDFLKSVLDLPDGEYDSISLDDTHLKREDIEDKLGIVDVKVTTTSGKIIHVEIQILEQDDFPERVTYYNAKMLVSQLRSGDDYKFKRTITIAIADFEIVKDSPNKYHHTFLFNDKDTGVNFTKVVEINTLELSKIPTESDNTQKYDWLQFLKAEEEEEFDMLAKKSPAVNKAVAELKRLSQDEEAQRLYDARQKALWDERSRITTSYNKGRTEEKFETIANSIKIGLTNEQIAGITGLPISEIETLRAK